MSEQEDLTNKPELDMLTVEISAHKKKIEDELASLPSDSALYAFLKPPSPETRVVNFTAKSYNVCGLFRKRIRNQTRKEEHKSERDAKEYYDLEQIEHALKDSHDAELEDYDFFLYKDITEVRFAREDESVQSSESYSSDRENHFEMYYYSSDSSCENASSSDCDYGEELK